MRLIFLAVLAVVATTGCDEPEEDFEGRLVMVDVTAVADDCTPKRFVGDAGVQFIGVRGDGGTVFTLSQQAVYGPIADGGVLESVVRQALPPVDLGRANIGEGEEACNGIFLNWTQVADELNLVQQLPGSLTCTTGPSWLPVNECNVERHVKLTDVGTCRFSCVRVSAALEISCEC